MGLVAVGLAVVERLHLPARTLLVSGLLFPHQLSAMVEQVTRQQEAGQREEQQAQVDPVGVSFQWSDHEDEERLLQQSDHRADHGLETSQGAEVVGWVSVGDAAD